MKLKKSRDVQKYNYNQIIQLRKNQVGIPGVMEYKNI